MKQKKKGKKYTIFGQDITFLDYETTGLNLSTAELVSVYATNPSLGVTIDTLTRPKGPISEEASRVNGITDVDLVDAYPNSVIIPVVANLWDQSDVICGWNTLAYDTPLTFSLCERERILVNRLPLQLDMKYVCKLLLNAEELKAHSDNPYSLVSVYNYLFDEDFDAHDAKADVLATMRVFSKMKPYILPHHLLTYQSAKGEVMTSEDAVIIQAKHIGETLGDVIATDRKYIKWLIKEGYIILSNALLTKHKLC